MWLLHVVTWYFCHMFRNYSPPGAEALEWRGRGRRMSRGAGALAGARRVGGGWRRGGGAWVVSESVRGRAAAGQVCDEQVTGRSEAEGRVGGRYNAWR